MAITLRVVGIFYDTQVNLGAGSGTVKDVMDAAVAAPTPDQSFHYINGTSGGLDSPTLMSAEYPHGVKSSVLGNSYPPGTYTLQEHLSDRPFYSVWQYYIFDKNNVFLNRGKGAIPYDVATVQDGQSVVWRLLNILAEPTATSHRLNTLLK